MPAALLVRFRPAGPWRFGPDDGARNRTDRVFRSDSLYSALTIAMRDLGWLEEWLAVTVASEPAIRLTSCYPYSGRVLLVEPPGNLWPVAQSGKLRWKTARLVPVSLVPALLRNETLREDQWGVDPVSGCLLPVTKGGPLQPPFRVVRRRFAPVDRVTGISEVTGELACLQFTPSSGMWFAATFGSDEIRSVWFDRMRAACRLLADTGLGGGRSRGWGRSEDPRFEAPQDLARMFTGSGENEAANNESAWWLLSLFSPSGTDNVDWKRGRYQVCLRTGRNGSGETKPATRMVLEGSVLVSEARPSGIVRDVAGPDASHPVYRSGIALAVPIPWKESGRLPWMVEPEAPKAEEPAVEEDSVAAANALDVPDAPAGEPPIEEPPIEEPPEQEPPMPGDEPPIEEPPDEEPPSEEPPVGEPPVDAPPVNEPDTEENRAPEDTGETKHKQDELL